MTRRKEKCRMRGNECDLPEAKKQVSLPIITLMIITRENLIQTGFRESQIGDLTIFRKGQFGIVYNFGQWLLCNCETGIPLNNRTYVSTMEEVLKSYKEYEEISVKR